MSKILIVEDDLNTGAILLDALRFCGHVADWVATADEAVARLLACNYELIILERDLSDGSGLDLCLDFRQKGGKIPIFMLSASLSVSDKVSGLDAGADDYLIRPFAMTEFYARVNALLRRPVTSYASSKLGDLEIDCFQGVVTRRGEEIQLRAHEMALLEFLIRYHKQAFSAKDLLEKVWSSESHSTEAAVRKTINRLREKLDVPHHSYILCRKNIGYQFVPASTPMPEKPMPEQNQFVGSQMTAVSFMV